MKRMAISAKCPYCGEVARFEAEGRGAGRRPGMVVPADGWEGLAGERVDGLGCRCGAYFAFRRDGERVEGGVEARPVEPEVRLEGHRLVAERDARAKPPPMAIHLCVEGERLLFKGGLKIAARRVSFWKEVD